MALTSIFVVFIGEDWHTIMHSHYRVEGVSALLFFPLLYISLNLIMLNLFLAILLQNFETDSNLVRINPRQYAIVNISAVMAEAADFFLRPPTLTPSNFEAF